MDDSFHRAVADYGVPAFSILIGFVGIAWIMTRDNMKPRTEQFTISSLWIYPIIGCRGVQVPSIMLEKQGSRTDRRYVIIRREDKEMLTLREEKKLVYIKPMLDERGQLSSLKASVPKEKIEKLPIGEERSEKIDLEHMGLNYVGVPVKHTRKWLAEVLGYEAELYELIGTRKPSKSKKFGDFYKDEDEVSLALSGQFLAQSKMSLDAIQAHCEMEDDEYWMQRFRPNIIVTGGKSFEEDLWNQVDVVSKFGWMAGKTIPFRISRCTVSCSSTMVSPYPVDEEKRKQPLKGLAKWRAPRDEQYQKRSLFGVNFAYDCPPEEIEGAMINEGDDLVIKTWLNIHPLIASNCSKLYST